MWSKELNAAIKNIHSVTIRLLDGEVLQGIPENCSDRVKLRRNNGVIWVPVEDIKHVSRLLQMKKDRH
ncbi:hypothetical protein ACK8P5_16525 [Paenibacillus sp. EC2-1]|uniref:hypothetical protein n=1 Tax=Paenibacillus sp. EC2-1 TaxID=3388665 RepID=UPI003BEF41A3